MSRRGCRATALLLGVLLAVTGCGTDAPPAPSASAEASASPSPSAPPSASPSASPSPSPSAVPPPQPTPRSFFPRSLYPLDQASSPWVVVNKLRPLNPIDFVPPLVAVPVAYISNPQMQQPAADAMAAMFAAGAAEGAGGMQIQNAYRSFATQTSVHQRLVASLGQAKARAQSAQPGFSEHQTGLSADITALPEQCSIAACFGETTQGVWLAANAWRFGYILRYPADKTPVTGYIYEPWHFRYVGVELSTEMRDGGVTTLEEFFGLPAAPDYAG